MTTPKNNEQPGRHVSRLPHMGGKRPVTPHPHRPVEQPRPTRPQAPGPPPRSGEGRPPRIALPFEQRRRKGDAGDWVYRHRVGLLVTVVLYLIAAIMFISYKIVINGNQTATMYIDLVDPNEPEPVKPEEVEPPKPAEQIDAGQYERVMNRASDQNSKLTSLKDDRGTQTQELYEEAKRVQEQLAAGQQAFREGMDELAAMSKRQRGGAQSPTSPASMSKSSSSKRQTVKVQGNVTVSYDLAGRMATYLHVPAYQCREGGTVVVGITVNRNGEVVNAAVEKASPGECIASRAVQAALASTFNADAGAPDKQRGTITYVFVAQ